MKAIKPITLQFNGVSLEPMSITHTFDLAQAAKDGELWNIRITSVPSPGEEAAYINTAIQMRDAGSRLPFVVRELTSGKIIGSTSYHDIVPNIGRVEIGYTWYGKSWQRSHVNTSCKLMLLEYAFENLDCQVVGFRTDILNITSQKAIERIRAKRDGVIRHHHLRRDGTVRDTVMYSILASEWPAIKMQLQEKLDRHAAINVKSPC
jgi:RimJ/RimL family protein N-acetyltransferase